MATITAAFLQGLIPVQFLSNQAEAVARWSFHIHRVLLILLFGIFKRKVQPLWNNASVVVWVRQRSQGQTMTAVNSRLTVVNFANHNGPLLKMFKMVFMLQQVPFSRQTESGHEGLCGCRSSFLPVGILDVGIVIPFQFTIYKTAEVQRINDKSHARVIRTHQAKKHSVFYYNYCYNCLDLQIPFLSLCIPSHTNEARSLNGCSCVFINSFSSSCRMVSMSPFPTEVRKKKTH